MPLLTGSSMKSGGRVLANNERATLDKADIDTPTFTLLRLPTSGVTACEFAEFATDGETRFVTVEGLLDDQLKRGAAVEPARMLTVPAGEGDRSFEHAKLASLSSLIRQWNQESNAEADLFAHLTAAKANVLLAEAGYLTGKPKDWHVTEQGEQAGIEETREWFDDAKKGASMQTMIRYSAEAAKTVKRALVEALRSKA